MVRTRRKPRRQGPSLRIHRNGCWTIRVRGKDYYLGSVETMSEDEAQRQSFEILAAAANGKLLPKPKKATGEDPTG